MMRVLHEISGLASINGPLVLAIGVFDGLHLGHRAVLESARAAAAEIAGEAVVVTFDPHPAKILRPESAPRLLTSTTHKLRLMQELGVRNVLMLAFDAAFAAREATDFVSDLVQASRPLARICVGEGWTFGHGRAGDGSLLRRIGTVAGFATTEVTPVRVGDQLVSSTAIRHAVEAGDFETARLFLGREYSVLGTVTKGEGIGRQLGFPTANLAAHNEQFPPDGVYAVRARLGAREFDAVANIGTRPTVHAAAERLLEVHLLGDPGDIYGEDLEVVFTTFLRPEKKFPSLDALRDQIAADIVQARQSFA